MSEADATTPSPYGDPYHKIHGLYKRDEKGKIIEGEFSRPEFAYLYDSPWRWTEKVDGTNIRLHWDGERVRINGRTDNAQIPGDLLGVLQDLTEDTEPWDTIHGPFTVYGEGYGAGIQKGGGLYSPTKEFIAYDVKIGKHWLSLEDACDVCDNLGLPFIDFFDSTASVRDVEGFVKDGLTSSQWPDVVPEGYVGTPAVPLFNKFGERIIVKVKAKDYQ